jgi:hypothetical protein
MAGLVLLAVFVAACAIGVARVWLRRRPEAPLRRAIRSQPVTFRIALDEVKEKQSDAWLGMALAQIDDPVCPRRCLSALT